MPAPTGTVAVIVAVLTVLSGAQSNAVAVALRASGVGSPMVIGWVAEQPRAEMASTV